MQKLRTTMKNARTFKFTNALSPAVTMVEGSLYLVEDTCGMLILDIQYTAAGCKKAKQIVAGEEGVLIYHAEKIEVDKYVRANCVFLPRDKVYWSGTQGAPVESHYQSGEYWIGICVRAAGATDSTVVIDLKGDKISLTEPL